MKYTLLILSTLIFVNCNRSNTEVAVAGPDYTNTDCGMTFNLPDNQLTPTFTKSTFGSAVLGSHDATGSTEGSNVVDNVTLNTDSIFLYFYNASSKSDGSDTLYYVVALHLFTVSPAGITQHEEAGHDDNYNQLYSYSPSLSIMDTSGTYLSDGVTNLSGYTSPTVMGSSSDVTQNITTQLGDLEIYLMEVDNDGSYQNWIEFSPSFSQVLGSQCNAIFQVTKWSPPSSTPEAGGITFEIPESFFDMNKFKCDVKKDSYEVSDDSEITFESLYVFEIDPSKVSMVKFQVAYDYEVNQIHQEADIFYCHGDGDKASGSPYKYLYDTIFNLEQLTQFH